MISEPHLDVPGLAAHLDWPEERVRTTLDELARLALVRPSGEAAGELLVVNPELRLTALLTQEEVRLAERQQEIANSRQAVTELIGSYHQAVRNQRGLEVERIVGLELVRVRLEELSQECAEELSAFIPITRHPTDSRRAVRPLDQDLLDRGVHMRSIFLQGALNDPDTTRHFDWLTGLGGRVRTAATLPLRMIVFDRRVAIVPSDPENTASGALLLRGRGLVSALCSLFEHVWEAATPYGQVPGADSRTGLTSQARAILSLLAQGYTDDVVARKIGVSVRTSRRITAELMSQLGARSRFQAGVLAGERGWLRGATSEAYAPDA
ncbi:LuxR family transcriptional regulator [Streptomyces sp. NPDC015220]|uniref:LuxR family transcriptional regulator n=1 Tax=Streptomyces sp. NPDC015220 TaxID=3364947 RepID=UPI0036FDA9F2